MPATILPNPSVPNACATTGRAASVAYPRPHARRTNRQPISISGPFPSQGTSNIHPRKQCGSCRSNTDQYPSPRPKSVAILSRTNASWRAGSSQGPATKRNLRITIHRQTGVQIRHHAGPDDKSAGMKGRKIAHVALAAWTTPLLFGGACPQNTDHFPLEKRGRSHRIPQHAVTEIVPRLAIRNDNPVIA
jgi:hypothetical protein